MTMLLLYRLLNQRGIPSPPRKDRSAPAKDLALSGVAGNQQPEPHHAIK